MATVTGKTVTTATTATMATTMTKTTATATVTAAMMTTTTAVADPFVAPAVGCCIVVRHPPLSSLVACCHAIADALVAGSFHRLCRSSRWLVLALSSTARSCHRPPMCDIQFPHRRAALRRSRHQPPLAFAIPVDGWLLRHRLPPIFIVLPLCRRAAPRRSRCQSPPTCAIPVDGWLLRRRLPPIFIVLPLLL
jgi:hypothetical protein